MTRVSRVTRTVTIPICVTWQWAKTKVSLVVVHIFDLIMSSIELINPKAESVRRAAALQV